MRISKTVAVHWRTLVPALLQPGRAVLDLGANVGRFSRDIAETYGCRVYAVGPDPELFSLIPKSDEIVPIHAAISEQSGTAVLGVGENRLGASILNPGDSNRYHTQISVPTLSIMDLLEQVHEPVGAIKMDIEGAEIGVLLSVPDEVLKEIPQITVELHDFNGLIEPAKIDKVVERLKNAGFYYVRMSGVGHQDTLFVNQRCPEFTYLDQGYERLFTRNIRGLKRVIRRRVGLPVRCN